MKLFLKLQAEDYLMTLLLLLGCAKKKNSTMLLASLPMLKLPALPEKSPPKTPP